MFSTAIEYNNFKIRSKHFNITAHKSTFFPKAKFSSTKQPQISVCKPKKSVRASGIFTYLNTNLWCKFYLCTAHYQCPSLIFLPICKASFIFPREEAFKISVIRKYHWENDGRVLHYPGTSRKFRVPFKHPFPGPFLTHTPVSCPCDSEPRFCFPEHRVSSSHCHQQGLDIFPHLAAFVLHSSCQKSYNLWCTSFQVLLGFPSQESTFHSLTGLQVLHKAVLKS